MDGVPLPGATRLARLAFAALFFCFSCSSGFFPMDWWRARFLTPIESGRLLAPPSELPQLELGGSVRHLRTLGRGNGAFLFCFSFALYILSLSLSLGAADVGVCNLPLSDSDNFPLAPGQSANPWIPTSGFESRSFVRNLTKAHCRVNSVQPSFRLHFNRPPGGSTFILSSSPEHTRCSSSVWLIKFPNLVR